MPVIQKAAAAEVLDEDLARYVGVLAPALDDDAGHIFLDFGFFDGFYGEGEVDAVRQALHHLSESAIVAMR